jgi:tetratricopeptide (TPR) repeat protein
VRRLVLVIGVVGLVVASVAVVQFFDRTRQYRRLISEGELAVQAGRHYAAVEAFTGALAWRPDSMVAFYRPGESYRALRRDGEAIRDLREAVRLAPDAPQPLVALGELYDLRNEPAEAAEMYAQAASRLGDEDPGVLYKLALARYRAGAPATAIAPLERILSRNDSVAEAHYLLGLVYRDTQNLEGAAAALEQAVNIAPSMTAAREELADLYRHLGRRVDEMRELQALASQDPREARRVAIALAEARGGQTDGALGTLNDSLTRAPNDSRVQLAIARVHLARAERAADPVSVTRALAALEQALGGTARRSEGLALYGRALYLAGDLEESERILRQAVATSPVALEAFAYLADASERLAKPLMARDALINLDVLEGSTAPPDDRLRRARRIGILSLEGDDAPTAVRYLQQVVGGDRPDADALGLLARAQWLVGDAEEAKATLAAGLAIAPDHPDLLLLGRTIR